MSLHRFFLPEQIIADIEDEVFPLMLADDDVEHARVLRLKRGERIAIVDAARDYFIVEVVQIHDGQLDVRIASGEELDNVSALKLTLIQGLPKKDKFEHVIRQATEVGVSEFIPLDAERSIVKLDAKRSQAKLERWQRIAKSAAMQSGQDRIPHVWQPTRATDGAFAERFAAFDAVIVCWEEAPASATLHQALSTLSLRDAPDVACVIGPEGGFSEGEIRCFETMNPHVRVITLGRSILRTETAAVVSPALIRYELDRCAEAHGERAL